MSFDELTIQIKRCMRGYEMSTGFKPTRIYLGDRELDIFRQGIKWQQHIPFSERSIFGMKVFEVRDDQPHIRCCV